MTEAAPIPAECDVVVVGAGPAGLSAATRMRRGGVEKVLVLEREAGAGGVPRHCGHPPFGMREFRRCMTGRRYAEALVSRALRAGVDIRTGATVVAAREGPELTVTTSAGVTCVAASRVVLATGVRETPRAPRLVSGTRPAGVLTTGALQSMVYLARRIPFRRPLIVGTELVSFSALLTCRHAGIRPVAMIEREAGITARSFSRALPMLLRVPLLRGTEVLEIQGSERVTGARVRSAGGAERTIDCDGVLFTGQFTPESTLIRMGHLALDPATGGPRVDTLGRCSDPTYFAAGNVLRPVETAGWCWREGRDVADAVLASLHARAPACEAGTPVRVADEVIRFAMPQRLDQESDRRALPGIQLRFAERVDGCLRVVQRGDVLWSRRIATAPERRVVIPLDAVPARVGGGPIEIAFDRTAP